MTLSRRAFIRVLYRLNTLMFDRATNLPWGQFTE